MKQVSLALNLSTKKTRKREFREQMGKVVPWAVLVGVVEPHWRKSNAFRPPFAIKTMLLIHYWQQWFGLSDPAMEEALHDMTMYREFAKHDGLLDRLPDESTILRFRHLLEKRDLATDMLAYKGLLLKSGTAVDAALISARSSTKDAESMPDPEMNRTKKGNQWYFGMKAHIGVTANSGLVHSVEGTSATVNDVTRVRKLLRRQGTDALADAGSQGAHKQPEAKAGVSRHAPLHPSKPKVLDLTHPVDVLNDKVERIKASIRAKVEHPFGGIKKQLDHVKARYRELKKKTVQLQTHFTLSNLWMARGKLMARGA